MGLARWWIKNAPGSPGSIAKAMAVAYSRIRAAQPRAAKSDLLMATLRARYPAHQLDEDAAARLVHDSKGSLAGLILQVITIEIPHAILGAPSHPHTFCEMVSVVNEVVAEQAPGA